MVLGDLGTRIQDSIRKFNTNHDNKKDGQIIDAVLGEIGDALIDSDVSVNLRGETKG